MARRSSSIVLVVFGLMLLTLAAYASAMAAPAPGAPMRAPFIAQATSAPAASTPAPTAVVTGAVEATPAATGEAEQAPVPNCAAADCTQPGPAITQNLKGDPAAGQKVFADNCEKCHGPQGTAGIDNPGSTDGTVPNLNPIDPAFSTKDPTAFAAQIDAFIEHGSTPDGPNPKNVMDAWGDKGELTPQQIADVIAYIMSLNQ